MKALELIDKAIAHCEKLRPTESGHGVTLALLREIKEQVEESRPKWISVDRELPKENGYYVCWCSSAGGEYGLIHYTKLNGWNNGFYNDNVTHWQIILPPKE